MVSCMRYVLTSHPHQLIRFLLSRFRVRVVGLLILTRTRFPLTSFSFSLLTAGNRPIPICFSFPLPLLLCFTNHLIYLPSRVILEMRIGKRKRKGVDRYERGTRGRETSEDSESEGITARACKQSTSIISHLRNRVQSICPLPYRCLHLQIALLLSHHSVSNSTNRCLICNHCISPKFASLAFISSW